MPISGDALTEARVGLMRVGGSRLGYVLPIVKVTINGTVRTTLTRVQGMSIRDILNGTPNTATFRVSGFTPTEGHVVHIAFGDGPLLFRGRILSTTKVYEGKPANVAWDCHAISEEWLLNRRKVTKRWLSTSATTILQETISGYTSGFSSAGVAPGLPVLDEFTATNEDVTDVFDRVCRRIGEDWQLDYAPTPVLHVPAADGLSASTITDSDDHDMVGIAVNTDLSQLKNRQSGEGMGSVASADIAVGQTTMPLDDTTFANASGGTVKSGPQFIAYTGKSTIDGTGSKVGGQSSLAPGALIDDIVSETAGNLSVGTYKYKASLIINGGETEAGTASGGATIAHITAPSGSAGGASGTTGGSLTLLAQYGFAITFVTAAGETVMGPYGTHTLTGGNNAISLTDIPVSSDDRVTKRHIYRTGANLTLGWLLDTELNDNSTTTATLTKADTALGAPAPATNTSGSGQIALSSIPTGPVGTTARKIYRTAANGSDYKYHSTISGNVTTTATDNTPDASLGQAAPASSTVGPTAGDTSLPVQELSVFASGGGWVQVSGQIVRYTGRSASSGAGTLTGVPASGIGAIGAAVPYDTPVINHPHLTGVTGILYAINKGEDVNLWVTRNDTSSQTFMASAVGGDGIHEADPIQDRRMSETEITARCDAKLAELSTPLVTVRFATRDLTVKSGRDVTVTLAAPTSISGTFRIQAVTISGFSATGAFRPLRQVECSSRRLSFEQILRILKKAA